MQAQEIFNKLQEQFGEGVIGLTDAPPSDAFITVKGEKILDIAQFLRDYDDFDFDYLVNLSGMDYGDNLGVVYHFYSMKKKHRIVLKVLLPKDNPIVPTLEMLWRAADWHEREAWDLYGIKFEGHHNLIRILNPYDWEGFPLRKDYVTPEEYHGMRVPY
jgi:NADH-quinone oxidoreductase subunit C